MYSVIIVDDEEVTKTAIRSYMNKIHPDFQVTGMFASGATAIEYLHTCPAPLPVDLVITDIRMPRMDGLELARRIHQEFPAVSVIIISGYDEFEYARQAMKYGVKSYLLKPLDFHELSENLEELKKRLAILKQQDDEEQQEELPLFFTDLFFGMIPDAATCRRRFSDLKLTGDSLHGSFLLLNLERNETFLQWKYGQESIYMALLNGIRMLLPRYQAFHLFRSSMCFYFVLLHDGEIPQIDTEKLVVDLYHLLQFNCSIQILSSFEQVEDLVKHTADYMAKDRVYPYDVTADSINPYTVASNGLFSCDANSSLTNPATKSTDIAGNTTAQAADEHIVIKSAIEYIRAHYKEDLTREDVSHAVYLSPGYFSRFFKQHTGVSFIDYLTLVRMEKATELLRTNMKVIEVARSVGYQSKNRFFTNFRQYSGYTPTEYRRQILHMEALHED